MLGGNVLPVAIATATSFSSHRAVFLAGAVGECAVAVVITLLPVRPFVRSVGALTSLPLLTLLQAYGGVASRRATRCC